MIEKIVGITDRFPDQSKSPTTMQDEADDKISIYSKVKNFTSETNDNNAATTAVILNILLDENKSTQKSIALLNRNIHELLVFLLKDKKAKDRERRF